MDLGNILFGFRRGRSTTDPVFALKILQEKYREKQKVLHMYGIRRSGKSLRQSSQRFDMVPGHEKRSVPEGYLTVIQDMYRGTKTRVKTQDVEGRSTLK